MLRLRNGTAFDATIKLHHIITRIKTRKYSQSIAEEDIKKSVFISQSKDIYTNLALEDWIYRKMNFTNQHILMLWQNDPCVVVGRHQNPWLESNVSDLPNITDQGVKLARRDSGGGTVFQDLGNLNLTFFTIKERYNRRYNLEIMTKAIFRTFGIKVDISPREDLTLLGYKISGTASKLGRPNAYHHCTLLVNVNEADLSRALRKQEIDIKTNATQSIRSKIMNLGEENQDVTVTKLMNAIGWEYMRTPALTSVDAGLEFANRQQEFKMVDPSEVWFPGITEIRDRYASWDWCFGKTPKFNVSKMFEVPGNLVDHIRASGNLKVTVEVEQGEICDVVVTFPDDRTEKVDAVTTLIGQKFSEETLSYLDDLLNRFVDDKDRFVIECVKKVMAAA